MGFRVFGRTVVAAGLVVGSCVALAPAALAAEQPVVLKAVIDEKVTKEQDGYSFTGTVACPEQDSPADVTRIVLAVRQESAFAAGTSDTVECGGEEGRARADGKWKVLIKTGQQENGQQSGRKAATMKPGKADAFVLIVQGIQFESGKGAVTLPE